MTMNCTETDDCSPTHSYPASPARPCIAGTTDDLLDCDCGYMDRASGPALLAVADARTSLAHLVTVDALAAGRSRGVYVAVCGTEVVASSLTAEESGRCRGCRAWRAGL